MAPAPVGNCQPRRALPPSRSMPPRSVARLLAILAGIALVLGAPGDVVAHAELVLASPAPGTGLAQAPAAVVIKFSEPLNLSLSRIEILDASGIDVGQGPSAAVPGDPQAMRRPLGLLPTGSTRSDGPASPRSTATPSAAATRSPSGPAPVRKPRSPTARSTPRDRSGSSAGSSPSSPSGRGSRPTSFAEPRDAPAWTA
jgi:methionine-rich copper-binding protein CopC